VQIISESGVEGLGFAASQMASIELLDTLLTESWD
jgi:hypothetical protein